mgnify:CR=1 FL=1
MQTRRNAITSFQRSENVNEHIQSNFANIHPTSYHHSHISIGAKSKGSLGSDVGGIKHHAREIDEAYAG